MAPCRGAQLIFVACLLQCQPALCFQQLKLRVSWRSPTVSLQDAAASTAKRTALTGVRGRSRGPGVPVLWSAGAAATAAGGGDDGSSAPLPGAAERRAKEPPRVRSTANYREAEALSQKLAADGRAVRSRTEAAGEGGGGPRRLKVAVLGGGLSGLACGKYLADAGCEPTVYEAREVLGGKVSAWQDQDGDWVETGLHIFFGAYPNMLGLFGELGLEDRLQWKDHRMTFAMPNLPGEFTSFEFTPGVPAPFNMALAILGNTQMLSLLDKVRMVPGLLPMLLEGQAFIDAQDELSVAQFMTKYGMPATISEEIFVAMAKALDFIDPDQLSMTVVLTAMNRFINEADGSQTSFLDGNQPERLCGPMKEHIERVGGGAVHLGKPVRALRTAPTTTTTTTTDTGGDHGGGGEAVVGLELDGGEVVSGYDAYVSAMPVDVLKRLLPVQWRRDLPFFQQLDELEGIPVINVHLWFDRKLRSVDGLCFSRSPLLSVYADMATCCAEYADEERSVLELVFAPCTPAFGAARNWIAASDEEVVDATMGELARLFPLDVAPDPTRYPATDTPAARQARADAKAKAKGGSGGSGSTVAAPAAKLVKHAVVRVPRSVYAAVPGRNKFRPSQETPIPNFVLAGDFSAQKFLGSMEGAVLAGKLAAEVVSDRNHGRPTRGLKPPTALPAPTAAATKEEGGASGSRSRDEPVGVRGDYPIAFGGGQQGSGVPYHP